MKIIIGFSRAKSPYKIGSTAIRLYLNRPYSHVYLNFYSETLQRSIIYEAVGAGVRFIGLNNWLEHAAVIKEYEIEISHEDSIYLRQWCIDNAGEDYGYLQNVGLIFANILSLQQNPFKQGINCSELIAIILQKYGYTFNKPLDLITPADIEDSLSKQPGTV